ncbi:hypothetical protein LINGRAHAP2_LOCUS4253, partial [Linum grandiflorum]
ALVVASSGIAATLLPDATTAHSHFRIPIEVHHTSTCMVKKGTELAELIKVATLIVWDEAPRPGYKPFGGKCVLIGGDFRQTLPVINGGSRSDCLNASFTRSPLWPLCKLLRLSANMRINSSPTNSEPIFGDLLFAEWVLAIGDGTLAPPSGNGIITQDSVMIPQRFIVSLGCDALSSIVKAVYTRIDASYKSLEYIKARAIITPTNRIVSQLNGHIMSMVPGEPKTYFSLDTLVPETPIMILRNSNPSLGLCNGTRVLIKKLCQYVIQGIVIGGFFEGRQFPVRTCYAMTINKSQG